MESSECAVLSEWIAINCCGRPPHGQFKSILIKRAPFSNRLLHSLHVLNMSGHCHGWTFLDGPPLSAGLLQLYQGKSSLGPLVNVSSSYCPPWKNGTDTCMVHLCLQTPTLMCTQCNDHLQEHLHDPVPPKRVGSTSAKLHQLPRRKSLTVKRRTIFRLSLPSCPWGIPLCGCYSFSLI